MAAARCEAGLIEEARLDASPSQGCDYIAGFCAVRFGSRSYGDGGKGLAPLSLCETDGGAPMTQVDDLSRSLITFEQNSTMLVVLEMSQSSSLAAGVVPV